MGVQMHFTESFEFICRYWKTYKHILAALFRK